MANFRLASTRKRGPQPSNLSVRLFLLDPENRIPKVTKQTCSKESIQQLMQNGCGPPQPEHCTSDDKVDFPLTLTNEQFKEKLVEIYPTLENSCFVFMRADKNNKLEELNPGTCCFRCYTPENVHKSERGQGRLYIQKIAENEISQCTHGVSAFKRLCSAPGYSGQHFVPIQPKQSPAVSTITGVLTNSSSSIVQSITLPVNRVLPTISRPVLLVTPGVLPKVGLSSNLGYISSNVVPQHKQTAPVCSTVSMAAQSELSSTAVTQATPSHPVQSHVDARLQNPHNMAAQSRLSSTAVTQTTPSQPVQSSIDARLQNPLNMAAQSHLSSTAVTQTTPSQPVQSSVDARLQNPHNMAAQSRLSSTAVTQTTPSQPVQSSIDARLQNPLNMAAQSQLSSTAVTQTTPSQPVQSLVDARLQNPHNMAAQSRLSSTAVTQATPSHPVQSSVNTKLQNPRIPSTVNSQIQRSQPSPVNSPTEHSQPYDEMLRTPPWPPTTDSQTTPIQPDLSSSEDMAMHNQPPAFVVSPTVLTAAESYASTAPQNQSPTTVSQAESNVLPSSSLNMVTQDPLRRPPNVASQTSSGPAVQIPVNMVSQNPSPLLPSFVSGNTTTPQFQGSVRMVARNQQQAPPTIVPQNAVGMPTQSQLPATFPVPQRVYGTVNAQVPNMSASFPTNTSTPPFQGTFNMASQNQSTVAWTLPHQGQFPGSVGPGFWEVNSEQLTQMRALLNRELSSVPFGNGTEQDHAQLGASFEPGRATVIADPNINSNTSMLQAPGFRRTPNVISGLRDPITVSSSIMPSFQNPPAFPLSSNTWVRSPGLAALADVAVHTVQHEQPGGVVNSDSNTPNVQQNQELAIQKELFINSFLENVKSTGKLEVSLALLDNDDLFEKLNGSTTIKISTVEIESTCKLQQVLAKFSLPSCLTALRFKNNNLNDEDIWALRKSLKTVVELHELDLSGATFTELSPSLFSSVLVSCSNLTNLCLTDNSLTNQDFEYLIPAIKSMKNVVNLNLSKSNLTETQANDILQKQEGKSMVSLDLSQNALQGNDIIVGICHMQSLEEIDLSHNHIRFFPLPKLEKGRDLLPTNTKIISLSSNHMTPKDVGSFFTLLTRSDLLELNLDFNNVGSSIWSLCPLRIKHLKVLSLANAAIFGPAVQGLATLLSLTEELEALDISSNNLMLADFQELCSPLSQLTQLKKLNLSNNPDGISDVLHKILPSLRNLEELRLSNVHLNGDDSSEFFKSLASLKGLKHLDLSKNAIGANGTKALVSVLNECPFIERLDMSRSCITEDDVTVLCQGLVHLNKLKYLNLSGNRIDVEALGVTVCLPPMIEELILSDIIHGEKLFASMTPLKYLRILRLREIRLRSRDVEALSTMLSSCPLLEDLVLTKVVGANCDKIFSAIKSLKKLRTIDLTGIYVRDVNGIAEMLSSLSSLEELVLANINVVDIGYEVIFGAIKSLKKLKKLDLTGLRIPDGNAISEMLSSLLSLGELVLANMHLANQKYEIIYSKIKSLKTLKKLNLTTIFHRQDSKQSFMEMLSSLPLLKEIVFSKLSLDDDETNNFCSALTSLKHLRNLDLQEMSIAECNENLARVLPSLQLLEKLRLANINDDDGDDVDLSGLFCGLVHLRYLKELSLEELCITQTSAKTLADVLPSLHSLEKLVVINTLGCEQFLAALRKLRWLKELTLSRKYRKICIETLAESLPSLQSLEKLSITLPDEEDHNKIVAALRSLKYLKELSITMFPLDAEALAEVLPCMQLLESLVLIDIGFHNGSEKHLFVALRSLKYLKELNIESRSFRVSQINAEALAEVLPCLQLLESLVLLNIRAFHKGSEKHLFVALRSLRYLRKLELRGSQYPEISVESLTEVLPSLQVLEVLTLCWFDLRNGDQQLFIALKSLSYLKELNLHSTKISPAGATNLAAALPSLRNLTMIRLPDIPGDENGQPLRILWEAARHIPDCNISLL